MVKHNITFKSELIYLKYFLLFFTSFPFFLSSLGKELRGNLSLKLLLTSLVSKFVCPFSNFDNTVDRAKEMYNTSNFMDQFF